MTAERRRTRNAHLSSYLVAECVEARRAAAGIWGGRRSQDAAATLPLGALAKKRVDSHGRLSGRASAASSASSLALTQVCTPPAPRCPPSPGGAWQRMGAPLCWTDRVDAFICAVDRHDRRDIGHRITTRSQHRFLPSSRCCMPSCRGLPGLRRPPQAGTTGPLLAFAKGWPVPASPESTGQGAGTDGAPAGSSIASRRQG